MTFKKLVGFFSELEKTSSRLKITEILADLFKQAGSEEIDKICYLSLGQLAPLYEGIEFNLAEKLLIRTLAEAYDLPTEEVKRKFKDLGDLGDTAGFFDTKSLTKPFSVSEVHQRLWQLAADSGEGSVERKIRQMANLINDLDALGAKFVVRIPLGRLRLGFSELTILDALSWMLTGDKTQREKIEAAYNVRADIGQIARLAKMRGLKGLGGLKVKVGTPVMPALCQRLPTAEEIINKMAPRQARGKSKVAVEPKYDGTRLSIHYYKGKLTRIFTRNLENITPMFPEIAEVLAGAIKAREVVLDGEAIGYEPKTGRFLPFQETIKRKRKYQVAQTAKDIPIKYFVFDILAKDGRDLLSLSFRERRQILEKTININQQTIILSPQIITQDADKLRRFHQEQIEKGLEGVVVKKWLAPYDPGRRGFTWVKLKQEKTKKGGGLADTLDCVVMGYYKGRGRRAGFGIGAFLVGVRESANSDRLLTVSKIGTGLSDEQWREMHQRAEKVRTEKSPKQYSVDKNLFPDVWCSPYIVVEIQADNITRSPVHSAGLAMRFPRLIRFREDKSASEATTLSEAKRLFKLQGST
jgi:DNA ligase-1